MSESAPQRAKAPPVTLGHLEPDGIAPSVFVMAERGAALRPEIARALVGVVEIRFNQPFAHVRITFGSDAIDVEDRARDGLEKDAEVVIKGSLSDIVGLLSVPLIGGVPRPTGARGRMALANVTSGRVRIEGDRRLARRLLALLRV